MRPMLAVLLALSCVTACSKKVEELPPSDFAAASAKPPPPGPDKLEKEDVLVGTGLEAKTGDTVKVHYTGTLLTGKQFDSSLTHGEPFEFTIGKGGVIKGWDEGVPGMRVGGKRKLTIPSKMAYGEQGSGEIPANAPLKFDIELVSIVGVDGGGVGPAPKDAGTAKPKAKDGGK